MIARNLCLLIAGLFSWCAAGQAQPSGEASGTLRLNQEPPLTIGQVQVREYYIPEELRGNPSGNHRLHILLSDRAAPPDAASDEGSFLRAAQTTGLRGVYLEIDLPDQVWQRISLTRPNGEVEGTGLGLDGTEFQLSGLTLEGDTVSGRVRTVQPRQLPDWGDGAVAYTFDVQFRGAIARAARPTERLSGAAARASPQAAAVVAVAELIAAGDLARLRAGLHPRLPFAGALRGSDRDARAAVRQAGRFIGSPAALRTNIQHVLVYGDRAIVVSRDGEGSGRFVVERENGAWMMAGQDQP